MIVTAQRRDIARNVDPDSVSHRPDQGEDLENSQNLPEVLN
jgi:hypothetical protein